MSFQNKTDFLRIRAPNPTLSQKWLLTAKLMSVYCLLAPAVIWLIYLSGYLDLPGYRAAHQDLFYPLSQSRNLFRSIVREAILEEVLFRTPIWILAVCELTLTLTSNLTSKQYRLKFFLIGLAILMPNIYWAVDHSVLIPFVFAAGFGWGWLVYKTKALWPAIVSHATANFLIYFSIKLAGLFIKI